MLMNGNNMVTKEEREELIKQVMTKYEDEYFKTYGFVMNSKQKKALRKGAEKMVDKEIKNTERFTL